MRQVTLAPNQSTAVGFRGDHLATRVTFPLSGHKAMYGEGGVFRVAVFRSADSLGYYADHVSEEANSLYWDLTQKDTYVAGNLTVELHYFIGDAIIKIASYKATVAKSIVLMEQPYEDINVEEEGL